MGKMGANRCGAGLTWMMRGTLGDILSVPSGHETILATLSECAAIAAAAGRPPRTAFLQRLTAMATTSGSPLKASMLRDIERGSVTEGDHILGDLTARARALGVRGIDMRISFTKGCRSRNGKLTINREAFG